MAFQAEGTKAQSPATLSKCPGPLSQGSKDRVGRHEVEEHFVPVEDELRRHHHGDLPVPAGRHQVTESLAFDEGSPLVLAEAAVHRGDVHALRVLHQRIGIGYPEDSSGTRATRSP